MYKRQPQPHWLLADWLRLMEPVRGESCPSGQRRDPAAPGKDRVFSPDQKSFHTSTTNANNVGSKMGIPGSILLRTVWKPQPHWLVADGLGIMEPAGVEGCLSCQGRGCAAHGEVKVQSADQNSFLISTTSTNREQDGDPTGRYRPTQYGNPNSGTPLSIGVREASGPRTQWVSVHRVH